MRCVTGEDRRCTCTPRLERAREDGQTRDEKFEVLVLLPPPHVYSAGCAYIRSRDCENTSPLRPYIDRLRPHCNSTPTRRLSLISRTPKLKETRPGRWWWWLLLREPVAAHMARADSTCRPESPAIRACSVPTIGTQPQARMAGRREQPLPQVARLPRGASCHLS